MSRTRTVAVTVVIETADPRLDPETIDASTALRRAHAMKAYWVNVAERTITAVDYSGLADLKRLVGGYIELAKQWPTGDVLYVDEEGLLKNPKAFFSIPGHPTPIGSNGVVVGREIGDTDITADPTIPSDQLRAEVRWLVPGLVPW